MAFIESLCLIVGFLALFIFLIQLISNVQRYFLHKHSYAPYAASWAVVTGASEGIGAAFARGLAARKLNLVLIARSQEKLDAVAEQCRRDHGISTRVITVDFASQDPSKYDTLASRLAGLDVSVLVNNVGLNVEMPTEFMDMSMQDVQRIVTVNIGATNRMTDMLLKRMVAARRGIILCLSSGGGTVSPAPLLAPYGGTKAYNDAFAVALSGEVKSRGVHVHSLTPFFVATSMAKMRSSFTVPSADQFATAALNLVASGSPRLQPYWVHHIMGLLLGILPLRLQSSMVTDLHRSIRSKAIRKKERTAKTN